MRKTFIAGNWKMNTSVPEGVELASALAKKYKNVKNVRLAVAVPFTHLSEVGKAIKGSSVELAAQNMNENPKGAFTGEISASMLSSLGVKLVIIGHSERRHIFLENDLVIQKKVKAVLENGFECILCVGETKVEREKGLLEAVLERQVESAMMGLSEEEAKRVIIAYEPVWAIGTGLTASAEDAEAAHVFIRSVVAKVCSKEISENIIIQYGGSVTGDNAKDLISMPNVDGALVGGASLTLDKFSSIVDKI